METDENDDETTGEINSLRRPEYNSDSDFQMEPSTSSSGIAIVVKVELKNRGRGLGQIAEAKVRNSTSDRATASIVNPTLRTYNIPEIVDKSKVRRAVSAVHEEAEVTPTALCGGIGYDGRKDVTLVQERLDDKCYTSRKTQEHVTSVSLSDGKFVGHISPTGGKAMHVTILKIIVQFLQKKNIINRIEASACDGTNTNVGAEGGINHLIQGRNYHWCSRCKAPGPTTFRGPLRQLNKFIKLINN